jgi:hypothetical protein
MGKIKTETFSTELMSGNDSFYFTLIQIKCVEIAAGDCVGKISRKLTWNLFIKFFSRFFLFSLKSFLVFFSFHVSFKIKLKIQFVFKLINTNQTYLMLPLRERKAPFCVYFHALLPCRFCVRKSFWFLPHMIYACRKFDQSQSPLKFKMKRIQVPSCNVSNFGYHFNPLRKHE